MANNAFETRDMTALQQELEMIKYQLEQASSILAQKDQVIYSLEQDLEHMIDQLGKIKPKSPSAQWLDRQLPGLSVESIAVA